MRAGRCCSTAGLDWKPLSLSPKGDGFRGGQERGRREIALAFGVPPLLLGLAGDNTHANYAEANRAFYRQTVIPLAKRTAQSLVAWLGPAFGDQQMQLEPDLDAVEALADERESLWRRVNAGHLPRRGREARSGRLRPAPKAGREGGA
jgi:HK97 family phage portal protein